MRRSTTPLEVNKALDLAQPLRVLDLLLVLGIRRDEQGDVLVDSALLQELLELLLETEVEGLELGPDVHATALPVGLGGEVGADLGVIIEGDVLGDELTFLGNHVDVEGSGAVVLEGVVRSEV